VSAASAPAAAPRKALLALIAALALALVGVLLFWPDPDPAVGPPGAVPLGTPVDFTLRAPTGPWRLADQRGKVVLVYFGYTACPDVCPTSLAATAAGLRRLTPDELARVQTVFVSVDPERDLQPQLTEYAAFFHPSIVGITGTPASVADAARPFGVVYKKTRVPGSTDYVVDHSALTYVIAPDGRLVERLPHAAPADQVVAAIRRYLPLRP